MPSSDRKGSRSNGWRIQGRFRLSQVTHHGGADGIRHRLWQSLPQRDQRTVPRVERIVLRHVVPRQQLIFVSERRWREPPVLLEIEGARPALAASIVEAATA